MAGQGGYLSQVVRDARPRAAPGLFAGTPAEPPQSGKGPRFARLMESQAPASDRENATGPAQVPGQRVTNDTAQSGSAPDTHSMIDDDGDTAFPKRVVVQRVGGPDTSRPAPLRGVAQAPLDPAASGTPDGPVQLDPDPEDRNSDRADSDAPIAPKVRVSAHLPRPPSFDYAEPAHGPDPGIATDDMPEPALVEESRILPFANDRAPDNPEPVGTPVVASPRSIRNAAQARPRSGPHAVTDAAFAPRHLPSDMTAATGARDAVQTEVHIGQVEVIVQEPPAPKAPVAPRASPQPPSPARYHIRRF